MREVNNNTANPSQLNFIPPVHDSVENVQAQPEKEVQETTDLSKMPSEVIGRSQVGQTALEQDVKFLEENYSKVEDTNRMFEYLVDECGISYEQAAAIIDGAIKEFS